MLKGISMLRKYRYFMVLLSFCVTTCSYAWDHSISLGYGYSEDPNHTQYNNSGFLLSADLLGLKRTNHTFWSLNGYIGQWNTTARVNKNLTSAALSLNLRGYLFDIRGVYPVYLIASAGPALISNKKFGLNTQASNATIQTNIGGGAEFKHFDINLRLEHFSNANLAMPNQGFNILYLLSLGYLF
jgi:hypothetical protein